jgi:mono/diheme cytochrome c family protein
MFPLTIQTYRSRLGASRTVVRFLSARLWILACLASVSSTALLADEDLHFFETHVRPLLIEHCQRCHGSKKQEAGLRLDSRQALLTGGDNGPAIAPGKPEESLLISAVRHTGDVQMPPDGKLDPQKIETLFHWVRQGAPWPASSEATDDKLADVQRRHWAFQPIRNPTPPVVHDVAWERTPIDRFVLAKLETAGLAPAPPADRQTLIRRVTFDLTGLPPTPQQVDAFVNDYAPDAYANLIDRLLESAQYGEQWARHWLDIARYADTKGYVYGREERFWVHAPFYRDWVVQAFNRDLPYDQFLLLQIAADQVAPQDRGAQVAMGFLTLGRRFLGVTRDIIDDRIDVVMRGTMGLTVACARCHDHKYDPIPTADYYALYGVFLNSTEKLSPIAEPALRDEVYVALESEFQRRQQKLSETMLAKRTEAAERVRQRVTDYLVAQTELSKYPEEGFDQVLAATDLVPTFVRRWESWLAEDARSDDPVFLPWRQFAAFKADEFADKSAEYVQQLTTAKQVNPRVLAALTPSPASMRDVALRYGELLLETDRQWKAACELAKSAGNPKPTQLAAPESEALRQCLYGVSSPCLVPDEAIASTEFYFDTDTINQLWKLQGEVDRWLIQSPLAPAHAVSLVDRELIRPTRIFRRGNPANRGPEVTRHFVSVVAGPDPTPFTQGSGRLELARAIVEPANPLTARVWVNRVWQHHFGAGLVRTASDFGVRADVPSHPELLDWLATRLVADGWSTKKLHRLILLSNAYQQRSDGPLDLAAREQANRADPENRLLSRMNVRRLTFEEIRDSLLAVAGRLDLEMGGRASDLFAESGTLHRRRTLYGLVDRQFLPTTFRVFDFANPDLHTPLRSETTVPQQALFMLNHPFVAQQAQALVGEVSRDGLSDPAEKIRRLYRAAYQRDPTPQQLDAALAFLKADGHEPNAAPPIKEVAWQYGYGELDETAKRLKDFHPLPYFSGFAWQGGAQWPDAALGWVQLTAQGGHPGNDLQHCCVLRWRAPHDGTFSVSSAPIHEVAAGNGIRCWILSSRGGVLSSLMLHNQRQEMNVESVVLRMGDTLDFVVDTNADLNSDQYLWTPVVYEVPLGTQTGTAPPKSWEAEREFSGIVPIPRLLNRWEQLAQVLLMANELMFVD